MYLTGRTKKFTLKNGAEIEGAAGLFLLIELEGLLNESPALFRALLAIANGEAEAASPEVIQQLKGVYIHARTSEIPADLRDVLLSAYHETPEGPVLLNPYRVDTVEDAREIERLFARRMSQFGRHLGIDDKSGPERG